MPDPGSKEPVNFALYSCHKPFKKDKHGKDFEVVNDHMWTLFHEALERHSGRFTEWIESAAEKKRYESLRCVIGGGDQVYSDGDGAPNIWELLDQRMHRSGNRLYPSSDEMKVWYRDIYRGYWGFKRLQQVYANYPNYMIWDDHELHDGWGSHKMSVDKVVRSQFLNYRPKAKNLKAEHARALIKRMIRAGAEVYNEYQHAHNPATPNEKQWDYHFEIGPVAVYVLDGRGHRNIERTDAKILGRQQLSRFKHWLGSPAVAAKEFVYVVSAVPVFHLRSLLGTTKFQKFLKLVRADGVLDDLRDHWEDDVHDDERCELLEALFDAAGKGARISILSGDVHVAAAFKLSDDSGNVIYQLTSSAITWNLSRLKGIALKLGVPEAGICEVKTGRGKNKKVRFRHHFERLALYARSNFAIVRSDPQTGEATFQLYGDPDSRDPINEVDSRYERELMDEGYDLVRSHAMARIPLRF
jgi:alkaline phosphatase D